MKLPCLLQIGLESGAVVCRKVGMIRQPLSSFHRGNFEHHPNQTILRHLGIVQCKIVCGDVVTHFAAGKLNFVYFEKLLPRVLQSWIIA